MLTLKISDVYNADNLVEGNETKIKAGAALAGQDYYMLNNGAVCEQPTGIVIGNAVGNRYINKTIEFE